MKKEDVVLNEDSLKKLEETHNRVRESMTPAQRALSDQVAALVEAEAAHMDKAIVEENRIRAQAKALCGVTLDMSEIEEFRDTCNRTGSGRIFQFYAKRGVSVPLYKTAFGTVDRVDNYLNTLERTVIDITNNSQFTALSFLGLIKLAFKRLLNRSK